jgi:hypothetical protein
MSKDRMISKEQTANNVEGNHSCVIKTLSWNCPDVTDETHENTASCNPVSGPRLKAGTSK